LDRSSTRIVNHVIFLSTYQLDKNINLVILALFLRSNIIVLIIYVAIMAINISAHRKGWEAFANQEMLAIHNMSPEERTQSIGRGGVSLAISRWNDYERIDSASRVADEIRSTFCRYVAIAFYIFLSEGSDNHEPSAR